MANQKFTVWNRGTSTDPRTSHDEICHLTFRHGGFAEEQLPDQPAKTDFDAFCNVMRKNAEKAAEFQGARKEMLAILCKGQVRFREGKSANKASQAFQLARGSQMKEFRSSHCEIVTPFRAVDRQKYEEQFPGEIEAKKLKTTMKMIEGKKREVVLVRKNPDGEWDLNLRTTTGVVQEERVDHGDEQIREGQMAVEQEAMEEDQSDGEEILPGGQTRPAKPEPTAMEKKAVAEALPAAGKAVVIKVTMTDFSSAAQEAYKKASSLDNKVKKWQSVPEDILERSASLKNMATALIASATAFSMSKKALHTDKMETALNSLAAQGIEAPLAWRALHFKEQLGGHLRFGKLEACAEMCGQAKDNMQDIMEDCLREFLGSLTVPLEDSKGRKRRFDPAKTLQDLLTKLLACAELPGSVVRDLSTLDTALQTDESRLPARKELEALREDASYVGVLEACFAAELMEAFAAFNDCGFAVANVEVVDRLNNALLAAMGESQSEVELVLK
ncbi:unnamed protein product, partial [Durusdinium trenchii]